MKICFLIIFTLTFSILFAAIINVPAEQPTIQAGINAAVESDTVLVQPGTYFENIDYTGKSITVASLFLTIQDTSYISQTIIDGYQNGSVVIFESGENNSALLIGVTITNGQSPIYGSGISCIDASPTLSNLKIIDNHFNSWGIGGGMNFLNSNTVLNNIELINNSAQFGGGFYAENSELNITNITFIGNESYNGGGICLLQSEVTISNALFCNNYSSNEGGAIWSDRSDLDMINSTIADNSTVSYGGGIYLIWSSNINLINCIFEDNYPEDICFTYDGYYPYSYMNIAYSNFAGGEEGIVTNGHGNLTMLEGNTYLSPNFVDLSNYHLQNSSPCIGAGIDEILIAGTIYQAPVNDLDGNPRPNPVNSMPDMGAYENPEGEPQVEISNNQLPATNFHLSNYPNPFNPTTTISFSLNTEIMENAELSIYNLKGQKIKIFNSFPNNELGTSTVVWDGTDQKNKPVSSGIYFYKLRVENIEQSRKMLLLK